MSAETSAPSESLMTDAKVMEVVAAAVVTSSTEVPIAVAVPSSRVTTVLPSGFGLVNVGPWKRYTQGQ